MGPPSFFFDALNHQHALNFLINQAYYIYLELQKLIPNVLIFL